MIHVRRIDHVAIHVDDVAATGAFYTDVLGLERVAPPSTMTVRARADLQLAVGTPPPTGGMWVEAPGSQVHMIRAERVEGVPNPFGPHVAFEVDDFDAAKRTLAERGLHYVEAPASAIPFKQLWLLDPSGNTVELWARR